MKLSTMRLPYAYTGARYVYIEYRGIRSKMRYVTYDEEQLPANDVRSRATNSLKNKKKSVQKKNVVASWPRKLGIAFSRTPWRRRRAHLSEFPVIAPTNTRIEPARAGFVAAVLIRLLRERKRETERETISVSLALSGQVRWLLSVQLGIVS